jgi:hypothetical protein
MFIVMQLTYLYSVLADNKIYLWQQFVNSAVFILVYHNKQFRKHNIISWVIVNFLVFVFGVS